MKTLEKTNKINELEILASNIVCKKELIKEYKSVGCDYCSGDYSECKDYTIKFKERE